MGKYWLDRDAKHKRRYVIATFSFCLFLAYMSETFFGVADITGAFIAGLTLSPLNKKFYIEDKLDIVSYALLSPVFFASIGLKLVLPKMYPVMLLFAISLTIVAVLTKIIGCSFGCKLFKYSNREFLSFLISMLVQFKYIKCSNCGYVIPFRHIHWNEGPSFCQYCGNKIKYIK